MELAPVTRASTILLPVLCDKEERLVSRLGLNLRSLAE